MNYINDKIANNQDPTEAAVNQNAEQLIINQRANNLKAAKENRAANIIPEEENSLFIRILDEFRGPQIAEEITELVAGELDAKLKEEDENPAETDVFSNFADLINLVVGMLQVDGFYLSSN